MRQVRFDPNAGDELDLVLFVNGVPTATAELKNRWTGQTVEHAIKQYRNDRDAKNVLFARRAFVHFALDAELAYMTTRLAGPETAFLPFNQGSGGAGQPGGAGNPGIAGWASDVVCLARGVGPRPVAGADPEVRPHRADPTTAAKTTASPAIIFPRYHQWHVVVECRRTRGCMGRGSRI